MASASNGRDCGECETCGSVQLRGGGKGGSRQQADGDAQATRHRGRQCEQMPAISITGLLGEKPAARQEALSASAAAPPAASPTAPQCSQMRKITGSPPAWLCTQATKALRLSIR